ncbi:efflux transporter outer membrane subunit [Pontixanthobacter aestiaquae]|uniref:Efflux transporter outer membrane subunit n=1 Tax=Pontixanthobacter aestiaquae TaxID=1509367 RepID=A0A844Z4K8_9SPHN|nr:efflux transporter outer membrane subunit [Pontixanthobacter aestiaquae]MDN3646581.1 efflux transporter outer membrane subunit [Pontixanthobacter aestiaquae]MXO82434.1 efflux transporter outer membrane subunit [Pontixanthobacter aestiaquae]
MRSGAFLIGAASIALTGCVAGPAPVIETPAPVLPASYTYAPDSTVAASVDTLLPIGDPAFAALSAAALAESPSLLEAAARIDSARANAAGAGANRLPLISGDASIAGTRTNPNQFGANLPAGIAIDTERLNYGANIGAVWDPDLFGQLRAQERAALSLVDAAGADAAAIRLSILAEIAGAVIDWRTLQAREKALKEDLVAAETLVTLSDIRERAGIAPGFDRVRAETVAETSRSRIAALASERARIAGLLVTLTAQSPKTVRDALASDGPGSIVSAAPASTPSELLANRPDIQAAAARLAASDAELYAAAANRFPKFTLSAALGLLAFDLGDLFDEDAVVGSASGSLLAPLLDFGRIEAQIDGAAAGKRAAFQAYRGRVFTALGEAETGYGLVQSADRELALAERERASAARAAELAEVRFRAGLANFLTVLDARRIADSSGERVALAKGRAQRARVLLWQALGGNDGKVATQ